MKSPNEDKFLFINWSDNLINEMTTTAVKGRYRLIRTGSTLIALFDVGDGWKKLASKAVSQEPCQIVMGNGSIDASHAFTTLFDNFQVNSGMTASNP